VQGHWAALHGVCHYSYLLVIITNPRYFRKYKGIHRKVILDTTVMSGKTNIKEWWELISFGGISTKLNTNI
jgi:hypothetical protein